MPEQSQTERVRILATSDVHMHLLCHDYAKDAEAFGVGLEALEPLIDRLRTSAAAEEPPRLTMLVDNGDMLQGNALGDYIANEVDRRKTHPVAQAMNALGYDVMGIGNHDLDYGLAYLRWFARGLRAPLISSNLRLEADDNWIKPHALLRKGRVTFGVLSVLPPLATAGLFARLGEGVTIREMRSSVRAAATALRAQGADIIIGLAHTGFGGNECDNILEDIAGDGLIDMLVGGHSHHSFPPEDHAEGRDDEAHAGRLGNVPCVMPGHSGRELGWIDLDLTRAPGEAWTIASCTAQLERPTPAEPRTSFVRTTLSTTHEAIRDRLNERFAEYDRPLTSYFARVQPSPVQSLIAAAQAKAIDEVAKGTPYERLPILSAVSCARSGGRSGPENYVDIPAGTITLRHLFDLNAYPNLVWAVEATGEDLHAWLCKSAESFAHVQRDGADIVNAQVPSFDFDTIYGLNYAIDITQPPDSPDRIIDLRHDGEPVQPDDRFLVAVNSFRACGGGRFPGLDPDRPVLRPDLSSADVLTSFFQSGGGPVQDEPWHFAQNSAGLKTSFLTGPGAINHLQDIAHLSPGAPSRAPGGFLKIPITL